MEISQVNILNQLNWPFLYVLRADGRRAGWILVNGPIVTTTHQEQFAELRRAGYRFAGMSSYMTFPRPEPGETLDYEAICEVWCHCFREPEEYLFASLPRALISVSDFTDYQRLSPEAVGGVDRAERFDFIYAGATEDWKREVKNWRLAGQCVPRLCRELGLRSLVIGAADHDFPPCPEVTISPPLAWLDLLARLSRAKFLFVPNVMDASPRLLAEALCLNVPVVVNRNILGGWKYVNAFTGVFFDGEHDVVAAARACLDRVLEPRDWFRANFGPYLAGKRLLRLLKTVDPAISEPSHLCLAEPVQNLSEREPS